MAAKVIKAIIVFRVPVSRQTTPNESKAQKNDNFAPAKSRRTRTCRPITLMMASQGTSWPNNHTVERPRGYFTEGLNYANA
jgi:hypothetical protein